MYFRGLCGLRITLFLFYKIIYGDISNCSIITSTTSFF